MGWVDDDGLHEGYVVAEFADGVLASPVSGGGVADDQLIIEISRGHEPAGDLILTRPAAEVIGWRILCDCRSPSGVLLPEEERWRSDTLPRVPSRSLEDSRSGKFFAEDTDVVDVAEVHQAEFWGLWWTLHMAGPTAYGRIVAARTAVSAAEQELAAAVSAGRAEGLTWEQVGRAAGVARQSAHERWGDRENR